MSESNTAPLLIIVMGVSGCGKSTLAQFLADRYQGVFLEADDFHSQENREHMAAGKPLTDAMREPWIQSMCDAIASLKDGNKPVVLAYSGLRRQHRQRFRELGFTTIYLHLAGPKELIFKRMNERTEHFMPSSLLDSQYAALEPALNENDIYEIDLRQTVDEICAMALAKLPEIGRSKK